MDFCDYGRRFCEHITPFGWCDCEEECCERKKTAKELFYDICKDLGKEPTLQEFMETTGYSETSYYKVRREYRLGLEKEKELKKKEERYAMTKKKKKNKRGRVIANG